MDESVTSNGRKSDRAGGGWNATAIAGLVGVLIGGFFTTINHWIDRKTVEQPRLELEAESLAVETHRLVRELAPSIDTSCKAVNIDRWTWRVTCTSTNEGKYHADVAIISVGLSISSDFEEKVYPPGEGLAIEFPDGKKSYRSSPGSEGDLWFYIRFDQTTYPNGVRSGLMARVHLTHTTIESARMYFAERFPASQQFGNDIAQSGLGIQVQLPARRD